MAGRIGNEGTGGRKTVEQGRCCGFLAAESGLHLRNPRILHEIGKPLEKLDVTRPGEHTPREKLQDSESPGQIKDRLHVYSRGRLGAWLELAKIEK